MLECRTALHLPLGAPLPPCNSGCTASEVPSGRVFSPLLTCRDSNLPVGRIQRRENLLGKYHTLCAIETNVGFGMLEERKLTKQASHLRSREVCEGPSFLFATAHGSAKAALHAFESFGYTSFVSLKRLSSAAGSGMLGVCKQALPSRASPHVREFEHPSMTDPVRDVELDGPPDFVSM